MMKNIENNISKNDVKEINAVFFFIDIRGSRRIFSNQTISNKLLILLEKYLNSKYGRELLTPFTIREGDALIGGTERMELVVDIYQTCLNFRYSKELKKFSNSNDISIDKIKFYFGAGFGKISTPRSTYNKVEEINGTAISNAKEASELAKKAIEAKDDYCYEIQNFQFYAKCDSNDLREKIINPIFYLIFEKLINSSRQNELFALKYLYPDDKNYQLAEKMNYKFDMKDPEERRKKSSQISNMIRNSNYELQKKGKIDLKNYLFETYIEEENK